MLELLFADIDRKFHGFELSVQLECGQGVLALLGASGCGKSLTLKCIAGIEKPDKGRIVINGETVFDSVKRINVPPQKRNTGFLFQSYALFPHMTVWDNIACVIKKPKAEKTRIAENIINTFELGSIKRLYPSQISGGQQQRTALARILVSNPGILMLDEPFSALDSHLKWSMEQELMSILADFKGAAIFVSHDRGEAYRISDKIAVMDNGRIVQKGGKEDVFNSPRTLAAAMITGCENITRAEKLGEHLLMAVDWGITLKTSHPVPDNINFAGVRACHFIQQQTKTDDNYLCCIRRIINEPFEKAVIFSFGEGEKELRFEVSEDKWDSPGELILRVPKDRIMLLE